MSIPVLVRSVGPEPSAGYYTQWTTFVPGYPKFKNQDTGVTQALYNGEAVEANLIAYRAHYLYFTGMAGEIIDRLVDIPLPLPSAGQYYDIPVTAYEPGSTGFNPDAGSSSGTGQPSGPSALDVVVTESFAVSTGNARVTPWMTPRYVQEREIQANRWLNGNAVREKDGASASVVLDGGLSTQLVAQDFGFSIPQNAVIEGIEVEVARKVTGGAAEARQQLVAYNWYTNEIVYGEDWVNFKPVQYLSSYAVEDVKYANGVWIAATYESAAVPLKVLRSTGGKTWSLVSIAGIGATWDAASVGYGNGVWIIATRAGSGTIDSNFLRSTDNGLTWSIIPTGFGNSAGFLSNIATDGAGTWLIGGFTGAYRQIARSTDNGATWSLISSPPADSISRILWTGSKFVAFGSSTTAYNSTTGVSWTSRGFGVTTSGDIDIAPILVDGSVALGGSAGNKILYSEDSGDTWAEATLPALPAGASLEYGVRVYYDSTNRVFRWFGVLDDFAPSTLYLHVESDDFPPTAFRTSYYDTYKNNWMDYGLPGAGPITNDRYGLSFEATHLLAPVPVSGQIYDEGYAVPGGPFAYDTAELFEGRNDAGLESWDVGRFGGPDLRGADGATDDGMRTWTAAEVNDPAFGVGYFARGLDGVLEVAYVRARIHYRADPTTDTLPAKRSAGLSGVAESPSGVKVAVGVDGKILRKPANSPTWDAIASGTTISLNAVEWVGDRFIAVGVGGIALDGGVNGSAWTRIDTGAVSSLWAIRRVPDTLRAIAVGNDDYAFERSRLGVWSA
jgi:hypothetical protein